MENGAFAPKEQMLHFQFVEFKGVKRRYCGVKAEILLLPSKASRKGSCCSRFALKWPVSHGRFKWIAIKRLINLFSKTNESAEVKFHMKHPLDKLASVRENLTLLYANNKGTDQPLHPHSLVSTFVIRLFMSIIAKIAKCKVYLFQLVLVAGWFESYSVGNSEDKVPLLSSKIFFFQIHRVNTLGSW